MRDPDALDESMRSLSSEEAAEDRDGGDTLEPLSRLRAPTGDITALLAEIDGGRDG